MCIKEVESSGEIFGMCVYVKCDVRVGVEKMICVYLCVCVIKGLNVLVCVTLCVSLFMCDTVCVGYPGLIHDCVLE